MRCLDIMGDKEQTKSTNEKGNMGSKGKVRKKKKDISATHMGEFEEARSGLQYQQRREVQ